MEVRGSGGDVSAGASCVSRSMNLTQSHQKLLLSFLMTLLTLRETPLLIPITAVVSLCLRDPV